MFRRYVVIEILYTVIAGVAAAIFARYITNLMAKPAEFVKDILQRIGTEGNLSFSADERNTAEAHPEQETSC